MWTQETLKIEKPVNIGITAKNAMLRSVNLFTAEDGWTRAHFNMDCDSFVIRRECGYETLHRSRISAKCFVRKRLKELNVYSKMQWKKI